MSEKYTTPVALKEMEVQKLVSRMRGELLCPGDADYAHAPRVYNAMVDKRPSLITHCVDVADVIAAVNFACEHFFFPSHFITSHYSDRILLRYLIFYVKSG